MKPLGIYVEKFVPQLMHLWLAGAKDTADEVRNNAIFGLGEMVLHGKDCVFQYVLLNISDWVPRCRYITFIGFSLVECLLYIFYYAMTILY